MKAFRTLFSTATYTSALLMSFQALAQSNLTPGTEVFLKENDRTYTYYTVSEMRSNGTVRLFQPFSGTISELPAADFAAKRVSAVESTSVTIPFLSATKNLTIQKRTNVMVKKTARDFEEHFVAQIYSDGALYVFHRPTGTYSTLTPSEVPSSIVESVLSAEALEVGKDVVVKSSDATKAYQTCNISGIFSDGTIRLVLAKTREMLFMNFQDLKSSSVGTAPEAQVSVESKAGKTTKSVKQGEKIFMKTADGSYQEYTVKAIFSDGGVELEGVVKPGPLTVTTYIQPSQAEVTVVESVASLNGLSVGETLNLKDPSGKKFYESFKVDAIYGNGSVELSNVRTRKTVSSSDLAGLKLNETKSLTFMIDTFEGPKQMTFVPGNSYFVKDEKGAYNVRYIDKVFTDRSVGWRPAKKIRTTGSTQLEYTEAQDFAKTTVFELENVEAVAPDMVFGVADPKAKPGTLVRADLTVTRVYSDGIVQLTNPREGEETTMELAVLQETGVPVVEEKDAVRAGIFIQTRPNGTEIAYAVLRVYADSTVRVVQVETEDSLYNIDWDFGMDYNDSDKIIAISDMAPHQAFCDYAKGEEMYDCQDRFIADKLPLMVQPSP